MRVWVVVMAAVIAALGAAAAGAYPTFDGPSGLVTLPTAEVVPSGAVDLAVDYQKTNVGDRVLGGMLSMYDSERFLPIRVTIGVADGVEVWGGYTLIDPEDGDRMKSWNAGLKYAFMQESSGDNFSAAIGGSVGRFDNSEDVDVTRAFLVFSKAISMKHAAGQPISAMAHLGVMWASVGDPADDKMTKPFVGIEFFSSNGSSLALEYRFKEDNLESNAPFSAAVRYPLGEANSPLWVQVGATNAALAGFGGSDNSIFVGLGYRFGKASR